MSILIFMGHGNHSNRLFQAIHIEAFCIENKVEFSNPSFSDMSKYYGIKSKFWDRPLCILIRGLRKIRFIKTLHFNISNQNKLYTDAILKTKVTLAHGWHFRVHELTKKYQDYFIEKYSLLPNFYIDNDFYKYFQSLDRDKYIVIGVHIRRGDYKTWENGKYYFTDEIYEKYMKSFSQEFALLSEKKIKFILFSNETINIKNTNDIIISKNEWYIDQLIMAKCDYLIGPLSTFTLWASYIGKVPYYHIMDKTGNISIKDFSYCTG